MKTDRHLSLKNAATAFCTLLLLSLFLTQCGKTQQQSNTGTVKPDGTFSLTVPSSLQKHRTGQNFSAQLVVDDGAPIEMTVDLENDQVTATTGPLSPGTHTFVIHYFLDGALVASATSQAQIISGQNTHIVFSPDGTVNSAPRVLETLPASNATGVSTNSTLKATFSQPMNQASLHPLNFTLTGLSGSVPGTVSYVGTPPRFEATFTPSQPLAFATDYTATLSTGISGILNEPLAATYHWQFTSADGVWSSSEGIDFNSVTDPLNHSGSPQIAVDSNGNAIAVWTQGLLPISPTPFSPTEIWVNRYVKGLGWGTPQTINTNTPYADLPQIASDSNGNALVVWQQSDGTRNNIWANRFNNTSGTWESAQLIETDNAGSADSPQIAVNGNGNAIAVWRQSDGSFMNIMSNRFDSNSGTWETNPSPVESGAGNARTPKIAVGANGNALAVWVQDDGAQFSLFANQFDANTPSWGTEESIEFSNTGAVDTPKIAIAPNGTGTAVWRQSDGSTINVLSNRFIPGTGWNTSTPAIDTENQDTFTPEVAVDPQGNALAVWRQSKNGQIHIFSSRYNNNTSLWETPEPIESGNASNAGFPQIDFDPNGNAIAVWAQLDSGETFDNVWANRFLKSSGWQTPEKIEMEDEGSAGFPQMGLDMYGNAVAVWSQDDGITINIHANRFR